MIEKLTFAYNPHDPGQQLLIDGVENTMYFTTTDVRGVTTPFEARVTRVEIHKEIGELWVFLEVV